MLTVCRDVWVGFNNTEVIPYIQCCSTLKLAISFGDPSMGRELKAQSLGYVREIIGVATPSLMLFASATADGGGGLI